MKKYKKKSLDTYERKTIYEKKSPKLFTEVDFLQDEGRLEQEMRGIIKCPTCGWGNKYNSKNLFCGAGCGTTIILRSQEAIIEDYKFLLDRAHWLLAEQKKAKLDKFKKIPRQYPEEYPTE